MQVFHYLSIPIYLLAMFAEWMATRRKYPGNYQKNDTIASLSMGVVFLLFYAICIGFVLWVFSWLHAHAIFEIPKTWGSVFLGEQVSFSTLLALILLDDFCFYWFHRLSHESRFWWAIHETHHSSEHYNYSTSLRQPILEPLTYWVFWIPLPLLGFHPEDVIFQMAVSLFYQYWIHTKLTQKIPLIDYLFNTPSHHRVHHGSNLEYLDRNYGGILIIWDRLFGSYTREGEPVVYGLLKQLKSQKPFYVATHALGALMDDVVSAPGIVNKLHYLFGPPGWRHDGTGMTVKQMRKSHDG